MGKANKILLPILSSWLDLDGDDSDVVMSSRVRIARNLEAVKFPIAGEDELLPERIKGILDADYMLMKMSDLSLLEQALLVEKHLISPYLMNKSKFGAVLINEAENSSVMINEEDHLRIQCMEPGLR
ncbi:ATP--guanido phosphotransferase, partial [Listeria welshimeri]|nr:ATP--guanido phosphotransferase [Listeria welshimeri]